MSRTSITLLGRVQAALRDAQPADPAWDDFRALYEPFVRTRIAQLPDLAADVDDIVQDVFLVLLRELPDFHRQRVGSFRAWLRGVVLNRVREVRRSRHRQAGDPERFLAELEDPSSGLSRQWDAEHDRHVLGRLMESIRGDFTPSTWRAFQLTGVEDRTAAEAAAELGLTVPQVWEAKSRVLRRLRQATEQFQDFLT